MGRSGLALADVSVPVSFCALSARRFLYFSAGVNRERGCSARNKSRQCTSGSLNEEETIKCICRFLLK